MPIPILFVCYENICRSPMAEGIFSELIARYGLQHCFSVSSAGTVSCQCDSSPDDRATEVLLRHGIDISALRAKCIDNVDLHACDWIFVMDYENYAEVDRYLTTHNRPRLHLMMDFAAGRSGEEIPDPYYDGFEAFEQVKEHLVLASEHILAMLMAHYPHLQKEARLSSYEFERKTPMILKQPDSSQKQEFLMRLMGEVRPVYGF